MAFRVFVPVSKPEYERARIKTKYRQNPIHHELLKADDAKEELEKNRGDLDYEMLQRLRAYIDNSITALKRKLPATDPIRPPDEPFPPVRDQPNLLPQADGGPPVPVPLAPVQPAPVAPAPVTPAPAGPPDESLASAVKLRIPTKAKEINAFMSILSAHPARFSVKPTHEIVIDGKTIAGSDARDLVTSMFSDRRTHNLTGRDALLDLYSDLGGTSSGLSGRSARSSFANKAAAKAVLAPKLRHSVAVVPQSGTGRRRRSGPPGKRLRVMRLYH